MKTSPFIEKALRFGTDAITIRTVFRILAVFLAAMHTWAAITSQSMNADGIAYLDIGDAYFLQDWTNAINPVWPPLYSWILGFVNFVFQPEMAWEFPVIHILNFLIFLITLVCFEVMWGKLRNVVLSQEQDGWISLPDWAWWALGYCLFIWTSLNLIQIWSVTPDMSMAALLYLAAGVLIDIRGNKHQWRQFVYLGLILGFGYLTKTFMFSMALVFLSLCLLLLPKKWLSFAKVLLAAGIFLLVSLPFIVMISEKNAGLTIGEAGTVTYLRYVHGIPFPHWQGDPEKNVTLAHPSRLIHQSPPVYEFGEPIGGTYPISTDPSYWFEGIELPFSFKNQLARLLNSGLDYLDLLLNQQGILFTSVIALYIMGPRRKLTFLQLIQNWALVIPAVAAFSLYGLVLVSGRYIGAFILLFWADLLANIRLTDTQNNRSWIKVLSTVTILGLLFNIAIFNLDGIFRLNPSIPSNIGEVTPSKPAGPVEVAQELQQFGVNPGDKVGVIGYAFDSFWARLARVKIVAEMFDTQAGSFWYGSEAEQQQVLQAYEGSGTKAVVAEYVPADASLEGWHQVGSSNYYIYLFNK